MSSKKYGSNFLKGVREYRVGPEVTSDAISQFLESLDCPRSLAVLILFRNGEHQQLLDLEFDPSYYLTGNDCRDAYAATKFLSKYKDLSLDRDLDDVAKKKFLEFELLCKQTNARFRKLEHDQKFTSHVVWLHNAVVRKISNILGEFSPQDFFEMPDWGPGASTLIKRRFASSTNKFQCETGITRELHALIPTELLREVYPLWAAHLADSKFPDYQVGNRVVTVPKDAKTNRVIAIEPGMNLWFQKSIGDMIGLKLRRCGNDLRYQSRNQELARSSSITDELATIDFSSASDSISYSVVRELLPKRWFEVMDSCRSHFGSLDGKLFRWEKFSSMGNGFTFQLESLIFFAAAYCCAEYIGLDYKSIDKRVSAYGDDVIVPSACLGIFSDLMDFYGFRINGDKSYYNSPFRESCGSHYYRGLDLKPVYLKDRLSSLQTVFRLANAFRRFSHRFYQNIGDFCDIRQRGVFEHLVHKVPSAFRLRIPHHIGDGGFISNFDEATPSRARFGIEGYFVYTLSEVSKTYQEDRVGYLLSNLWAMPNLAVPINWGAEGQTRLQAIERLVQVSPKDGRNSVHLVGDLKLRISKSLVQQWCNLGEWI
ncbi:TPA_asm: RNA-directed RNA polymerase [ssRNA phage Gerhypos.4_2]|uniref:RNA-directed RNA polymerase n=2 Tax=Fiersviridae TaxID=2842319 RepID=A0A8S5KXP2_9VIRU|nr:RNA-directed RNA polymerase [ssRNA phage Gerhypos.4_2]QDH89490.1 MAG: RNA-dependent RNA polymerase [Leviviridae sp.]DAD50534.1 TPA_asm: RNA-directed RNA polymerase [ssRNA phage Gerhypos.4_2]